MLPGGLLLPVPFYSRGTIPYFCSGVEVLPGGGAGGG